MKENPSKIGNFSLFSNASLVPFSSSSSFSQASFLTTEKIIHHSFISAYQRKLSIISPGT
jgi:hypothetical protein